MAIIQTVIQGGGRTPTGTLQITMNGTHDVTNYATADVQVPTTAPTYYVELEVSNGVLQQSKTTTTTINLTGVTTIGSSVLANAYKNNLNITTIPDFSHIVQVDASGLYNTFNTCNNLTGVLDLSALTTAKGTSFAFAFQGTKITKVIFSNLTTIETSAFQQTFQSCGYLAEVIVPDLMLFTSTNAPNMFNNSGVTTVTETNPVIPMRDPASIFKASPLQTCIYERLEYLQQQGASLCYGQRFQTANMYKWEMGLGSASGMFAYNTALQSIYFPVLTRWSATNGAQSFLQGCTNANFTRVDFPMLQVFRNQVPFTSNSFPSQVTVHFRKDQQTALSTLSAYPFGSSGCVFDLVGTITVNGVDYIRQGKQNQTGYYAWMKSGATITVDGIVYTFDIGEISRNTNPVALGPVIYGWKNGSTIIYTDTLDPQVGDFIYPTYNVAKSTTQSITAVDNAYIYTADSAEPDVGDNVYSDAGVTLVGTISAIA